jgi:hypothetical protein
MSPSTQGGKLMRAPCQSDVVQCSTYSAVIMQLRYTANKGIPHLGCRRLIRGHSEQRETAQPGSSPSTAPLCAPRALGGHQWGAGRALDRSVCSVCCCAPPPPYTVQYSTGVPPVEVKPPQCVCFECGLWKAWKRVGR